MLPVKLEAGHNGILKAVADGYHGFSDVMLGFLSLQKPRSAIEAFGAQG